MLRFHRRALGPLQKGVSSFSSTATKEKLFDKVLIANRGEIACRVIRTCRRLGMCVFVIFTAIHHNLMSHGSTGIKTVAVYSEPDVNSVHVRLADEAVCVGYVVIHHSSLLMPLALVLPSLRTATSTLTALWMLFVKLARKRKLPSMPVYGQPFISIKRNSSSFRTQVNTIPGFQGVIQDEDEAVKVAREVGYPVMVKASAGGGGKGMRVAYNDAEVREGYRLSKEEAANSFGDDRMFIEKFIEDPRHIEIQLLADTHGNYVPFPERECSIQRRNQKVIEEAPSMLLDEATRRAMGYDMPTRYCSLPKIWTTFIYFVLNFVCKEGPCGDWAQAVMLAKKVGYTSAGTVEFLCDKHKNFYFLEMNTRLQVEHPVTELITKVDLVEQMLRIAAGHALPAHLTSGPLPIYGWAMESRVYAEDPLRGFLPSIGRLLTYDEPHHLPGVRVDSGVTEGSDISMHYDPMISKLVTHGKVCCALLLSDRKECLERMKFALDHYVIRGPGNNMAFMQDVYRHPRFESGNITTKFIAEEYPDGFTGVKLNAEQTHEVIVAGALMHLKASRSSNKNKAAQVWTTAAGTTVTQLPESFQGAHAVRAVAVGSTIYASVGGSSNWVIVNDFDWSPKAPLFSADISANRRALQVLKKLPEGFQIQHHGAVHDVVGGIHRLLVSVAVQAGDHVQIGQEVAVVEAMKMQNVIRASKKGIIKAVLHPAGAALKVDEIIVEFE
ncbi:hypothetical protein DYB35_011828 [Aphanomyces astaci]|uniref:Propionyl-CoA carboxylase alpha chain, mitochondrial n=2 Tax=Aphanomyces astaci TaxID=112090 RepID=A0A3R6ZUE5_APHAT|nr:hypothetical protein DYB35_011828 [Aphanomyces astaci]